MRSGARLLIVRTRRRRRAAGSETYSGYIYKVLKQLHPEIGIFKVINSSVNDMLCPVPLL